MSESRVSLKERVIKGLFWLGGLTFLSQLITWAVTIIVIRLLTPADYGLMAMALVYIGFLTLVNEMGLGPAIIQKKAIDEQELKKVSGFVIIINTALFGLMLIAAPFLAGFFSEPRLIAMLRVLSINLILISLYVVPQSILMRELNFRRKSLIDLTANLSSSGVVLILALNSFGVWALIWGNVCMNLIKAVAFNSQKSARYWPLFSIKGMKQMISFGGHITLTRTLWYFYSKADIVICGYKFGKELLGIYSVAMHLVSLPIDKISPLFIQIGLPAFSRIQKDPQSVRSNFLKIVRSINFFSFPCFIGLAILAPELMQLILGPKWANVVLPIQILCFVMPFRFINILFAPVVTAVGRPEVITKIMSFTVIIMTASFLIGSFWGIIGLCYAWLTAFPVVFLITAKRSCNVIGLPLKALFNTALIPLIGSIGMAFGILAFKWKLNALLSPLLQLLFVITIGIAIYCLTLFLFNKKIFREIRLVFSSR